MADGSEAMGALGWAFVFAVGSLVAVGPTGCAAIAGLDDLVPAEAGSGGAGGSGGSATGVAGGGGTAGGGAGGGTGAAGGFNGSPGNWTPDLGAVYLFENDIVPGANAAGGGLILTSTPDVGVHQGGGAPQGQRVLSLLATASLSSEDAYFDRTRDQDFTWGGWFMVREADPMSAISRFSGAHGYDLRRNALNTPSCEIGTTTVVADVEATAGSWLPGGWVHVVCRYRYDETDSNADVSIFVAGTEHGTETISEAVPGSAGPFTVGNDGVDPFVGDMDELFFVHGALEDLAIRRIFACGIEGTRCTCNPSTPTEYTSCGRLQASCGPLPACNAPSPAFLQ